MRNPIHRKKLSRFLALVLTALVVLSISGTAFAQENAVQASGEITPKDNGYYTWRVKSCTNQGVTTLNAYPEFLYSESGPATHSGETYTVTFTDGYSVSISGSVQVTYLELTAAVGTSVTGQVSVSVGNTSAPLNQGQCADAYVQPKFTKYKVVQERVYVLHPSDPNVAPTGEEKTCYVYVPAPPVITFRYHY